VLSSFSDEQLERFLAGDASEPQTFALREWKVEDFSSAYLTHRDHLVTYAKRFLPNGWEAEEVVQDAFLYLMTALPELDSEIGVLRFLKWKTKMLAIDINRSKYRSQETTLEVLPEVESVELDPVESITRADDAAIVKLALAKLSDRQKDALIATQLEGKSIELVAEEMGLSSNAFRQLLHRARAAFKVALVGEAEIRGLTATQILSVAARKAAASSITKAGAASVFVLLLALVVPSFMSAPSPLQVSALINSERLLGLVPAESEISGTEKVVQTQVGGETVVGETEAAAFITEETGYIAPPSGSTPLGESPQVRQASNTKEPDALVNELDEMLVRLTSFEPTLSSSQGQGSVLLSLGDDLNANIAYDLDSENVIQFATFTLETQIGSLTAVPQTGLSVVENVGAITRVTYAATDLLVGDFSGNLGYATSQESNLSRSGYLITLDFDQSGTLVSSNLKLVPRV
jgi:RNA polymerase sigma factor (sigma-70 family)